MATRDIRNLLSRLGSWLSHNRSSYYAAFAPGVSDTELDAAETRLGFPLPHELRQLYKWHDGTPGYVGLVGGWDIASLSQLLEEWETLTELLDSGDFDRVNWWSSRWLPFWIFNGDSYCVDTEGTFTGQPGQIIRFWHDSAVRTVCCTSLTAFLEVLVTSLEEGNRQEWPLDLEEPGYPKRFEAGI